MSKLIVSPITNHANRIYSHRTGWARMWQKCLPSTQLAHNCDWSSAEVVYFEHGMEFNENSKGVNAFLKDPKSWDNLARKARMIQGFEGKIVSLDIDCPDYGMRLRSRVKPHSTDAYKNLDFQLISERCKNATTMRQSDRDCDTLVLGDSHALAAWREDAFLCRNDGQTLNGAINRGFAFWIDRFAANGLSGLRTYFGNIDIRHHICRLETSETAHEHLVMSLVQQYVAELVSCRDKYELDEVEVVAVLPIENESRKLPKTGWYKGKPFWGSWAERTRVAQVFNEELRRLSAQNNFTVIEWPACFKNIDDELDFGMMERPRSVHISPEHYLWRVTDG